MTGQADCNFEVPGEALPIASAVFSWIWHRVLLMRRARLHERFSGHVKSGADSFFYLMASIARCSFPSLPSRPRGGHPENLLRCRIGWMDSPTDELLVVSPVLESGPQRRHPPRRE